MKSKMTAEQLKEVNGILSSHNVDEKSIRKIIDFLGTSKVRVDIEYPTSIMLKKTWSCLEPAIIELQGKGYNLKAIAKGLIISIEYLYQVTDVQVAKLYESKELPSVFSVNYSSEEKKRIKLGNLLLQRDPKLLEKCPLFSKLGRDAFFKVVNTSLVIPAAGKVMSDAKYERVILQAISKLESVKTSEDLNSMSSEIISQLDKDLFDNAARNIIFSVEQELKSKRFSHEDIEKLKEQCYNLLYKLYCTYPQEMLEKFMPYFEKVRSGKTADEISKSLVFRN